MKNRNFLTRERELNKALTRDLNDFIDLTEARKENRKELARTILASIFMILIFAVVIIAAASIEQPDVPSNQTAAGEVRI
ncbi:hypothetical protein A2G06_16990 (plasmid) [Geobacter anodireducens]|nr:hypothetical protein A2G06_16990 [Geobacter anodireducens]